MRDYVRMKPEFIKIWVDDRRRTIEETDAAMYLAIIEEAHKANIPLRRTTSRLRMPSC